MIPTRAAMNGSRRPLRCGRWATSAAFCLAALAAASGDEPAVWRETRFLAAPEAFQAAAADERHVYAIASDRVARYDRRSGARTGVSQGPAQHLNSGFLWEGKLLCAHSNYPRVPESSQIMALDLATLRLSTFKDFGDFAGSLTWVVRHADHWWCNFAHYGANNARTALVKFDDAWREQERFAYPPEVVRELGSFSISGGLWRGGELLATGHDERVLFRLGLPQEGRVLAYRGRISAPFTGQGIAHDPATGPAATGGLVGIDRGRRRIVFAAPGPDPE